MKIEHTARDNRVASDIMNDLMTSNEERRGEGVRGGKRRGERKRKTEREGGRERLVMHSIPKPIHLLLYVGQLLEITGTNRSNSQ